MIRVLNVNHYYGRFQALKNISVDLPAGEIVGLIGPNGAGKSTLLKILAGFLVPTEGEVIVGGHSLLEEPIRARQSVGYVQELPYLYREMLVDEYLRFVAGIKGMTKREYLARRDRLAEQCGLKLIFQKRIGSLSKGNRQRVALAQALIGEPAVLLLDEPTSALDPRQLMEIRLFIRSLKGRCTVLMSSHILSEISEVCDRVVMIREGVIQFDGGTGFLQAENAAEYITLQFGAEDIPSLPDLLSKLPGAKMTERNGGCFEMEVAQGHLFYPCLFQMVVEKRIPLRQMTKRKKNLESLFAHGERLEGL